MFGGLRILTILVCGYGVPLIEGGNFGYQYPPPAVEAPVPPPSNYYAPVDYQPVINPNPEPTYSYYPPGPPTWDNVQWQPVESLPSWSYDDSSERVKPYYPSYQYVGSTTPCPKKDPPTTTTTKRTTVIPITTTTLPPKVHGIHSLLLTKGVHGVLPAPTTLAPTTLAPTTLAPTTLAPTTPLPVPPRPVGHGHLRYHDHHKHHNNPDHYHKHHYHHHHQGSTGSATVVQNTAVAPRINAVIRDLEEKVRELKLSFFNNGRLEDVNGRVEDTVSPFAEKKDDPQEKEGETATDEGAKDSGRIGDLTTQTEHAEQQPETKVTEELDPDNEESDMHPVDQNEGRLEANVHLQPEHRKVGAPHGVVPWFNGVDIDLPRDLPLEDDYGYGNRANYGSSL